MIPDSIIIGKDSPRVANTSLIAFQNISAESLVIALDIEGYEVSSGSACSSKELKIKRWALINKVKGAYWIQF